MIRIFPWLMTALVILLLIYLMVHLMTVVFIGMLPLMIILSIMRALRR